jgi:ribosome maturation factor RimP
MAKITDKIEVLIQPVIEDMGYELVDRKTKDTTL